MMRMPARSINSLLSALLLTSFTLMGAPGTQVIADAVAAKDPAFSKQLRKKLLQQLRDDQAPGALVYVDHPTIGTWSAALGSSNLAGDPIDIASHMRLGSVTKPMTAVAVLRLVDQGRIDLNASIESYLPGKVPNGQNIAIRQLLNMTAGLFNNTEDIGQNQELDRDPFQVFTVQQSLDIGFSHDPYFPPATPGKGWHYSNTNYLVLGLLLEKIKGAPVTSIFQELIFGPLGMAHSSIPPIESNAFPLPHPRGYLFGSNVDSLNAYLAAINGNTNDSKIKVPHGVPPQDATDWNPSYTWTAGSAISTLADMAIWAKALGTGQLLSQDLFRQQIAPTPFEVTDQQGVVHVVTTSYGLGIVESLGGCESRGDRLPRFIGHSGAIPGFQTLIGYSPETGGTIVVLANSEIAPNKPLGKALPAENLAKIIQQDVFLEHVKHNKGKPDKTCAVPLAEQP